MARPGDLEILLAAASNDRLLVVDVSDTTDGPSGSTKTIEMPSALAGYVIVARAIATTAPLTGGGDLSADRTLGITAASSSAAGSMSASDKSKMDKIESGTYVPLFGNRGGIASLGTTFEHCYHRSGNIVSINGAKGVTPSSAGQCDFDLSVPFPPSGGWSSVNQARGPVSAAAAQFQGGGTFSRTFSSGNTVQVRFFVASAAALNVTYSFQYPIA